MKLAGFAVNKIPALAVSPSRELDTDREVVEKFSVNPPNVYGFGHQAYYEHVVKCLNDQGPALVDGLQGRKSLELISALYEIRSRPAKRSLSKFAPQLCRLGELP